MTRITPFLWFDSEAEEAAEFYTAIFERSRILTVARYGDAGPGRPGSVMTVSFELDGESFIALNGGQQSFHFNESVSFMVNCRSQAEVDYFWGRLSEGGEEGPWLAQGQVRLVVANSPRAVAGAHHRPGPAKAQRAMGAMLEMKKIDISGIERAAAAPA